MHNTQNRSNPLLRRSTNRHIMKTGRTFYRLELHLGDNELLDLTTAARSA